MIDHRCIFHKNWLCMWSNLRQRTHGALVRRNELYVYPLERRRGLPRSLDMSGWVLKLSTIDHGDPGTLGHRNLVRRCSKQVLEQFAPPFFTCLRNFHVHDPVTVRQPIQQLSWHKMWSPVKQNSLTFRLLPCTSYIPVLFQFWNVSAWFVLNEVHATASKKTVNAFKRQAHLSENLSPRWEVARMNLGEANNQLNLQQHRHRYGFEGEWMGVLPKEIKNLSTSVKLVCYKPSTQTADWQTPPNLQAPSRATTGIYIHLIWAKQHWMILAWYWCHPVCQSLPISCLKPKHDWFSFTFLVAK